MFVLRMVRRYPKVRFYAMVIGFALRKKVLPVIYSLKQTNVLEDMGFEGRIWDLRALRTIKPNNHLPAGRAKYVEKTA